MTNQYLAYMTETPLRILFVIDYYTPHIGGLEVVFENIITRLLDKGHEVGIVTTRHMKTLPAFEQEGRLRIWRVGSSRNNFLRYGFWKTVTIAHQFDQIHTTTYAGAIPASIAGKLNRKPVLITIHEIFGNLWDKFKNRGAIYRRFERLIFQFPYNCYTCVSHFTKQKVHALYDIPLEKLHVIHNGVDEDVWNTDAIDPDIIDTFARSYDLGDKFVGLYYGHSGASKGLDYFIRAIPAILKEQPDFHAILNIIPTQRDHKILQLIDELGIKQHILLLHGLQREQLVSLVEAADCVVVPSISEGFGLVAAEVSQLQKPIVTTKKGALPEVVSGKVVFLKDLTEESFVTALQQIKNKQRKTIPHKHFSWKKTITAYEKLYRSCTRTTP